MIGTYGASLVSKSFWFVEFKKIVKLVSEGKTEQEIKHLCIEENLFGAKREYRAKEIYGGVIRRIRKLDEPLFQIFLTTDIGTQKLINFIIIVQGDRLFFEFLYEVYREKIILGQKEMTQFDLNTFFSQKETQSKKVEEIKDTTKKRLGASYFNFMINANLLTVIGTKKMITPPIMDLRLEKYLEETGWKVLLKAIKGVG